MRKIFYLIIILCLSSEAFAKPSFKENFISYFASIKSSEVNVRKGPNSRYPIQWVFKKKGEPVEVIAQFEHWYKIKDYSGEEGWVKSAMVNKKRTAIAINNNKTSENHVNLFIKPSNNSKIIAKIELSKRIDLIECNKEWCRTKIANLDGWIEKIYLWGVYNQEVFK
jgi:SH3-like domain-containing protein